MKLWEREEKRKELWTDEIQFEDDLKVIRRIGGKKIKKKDRKSFVKSSTKGGDAFDFDSVGL